jgi:hypothetical protein
MFNKLLLIILICFSFVALSNSEEEERAARERIFKQFGVPEKSKAVPNTEDLPTQDQDIISDNQAETDIGTEAVESDQASGAEQNPEAMANGMAGIDVKKIQEMAEKMQASGTTKAGTFDGGFLGKIMNDQMKDAAAKMMQSNPFKMMSNEDVKSMILGRFKPESPIGKFFNNNPNAVDGTVAWIKDEHAIPSFISIINKPEKMKYFGYSVLAVFLIAFFLNLKNGKNGILKRILFKIVMMASTAVINLGVFYYLFKEELQPSINVIIKYI